MTKAAELAKMGEVLTNSQIGGRRNIIINGAMQVAQRGTSATSTGFQTCDRIQFLTNNTDNFAFTVSQSSTAPDGFSKSQKLDCTTAESSLDADELARFLYKIEGQDVQHFNYGSSASEEVTVSFYVRSNVTGVYTVEFRLNADGASTITKQYTISSANTWERKILKLPTNTATSITNDNSNGFEIAFCVAAGSNFTTGSLGTSWATTATSSRYAGQAANIMSSTDNEWYITGIQMEVGSQATPFEHRSVAEELRLCQRYYEVVLDASKTTSDFSSYYPTINILQCSKSDQINYSPRFLVEKRSHASTMTNTSGTNYYRAYNHSDNKYVNSFGYATQNVNHNNGGLLYMSISGGTEGKAFFLMLMNSSIKMAFDSEL